jgi:hypothetical protein
MQISAIALARKFSGSALTALQVQTTELSQTQANSTWQTADSNFEVYTPGRNSGELYLVAC